LHVDETFLDGALFMPQFERLAERVLITSVERTVHGPFERLSFAHARKHGHVQHSVYRIGDTLIDTGGTRVAEALLPLLAERPPRRIVLTHQHEDHVGNVGAIRRAFGQLPVHAPRAHLPIIATTAEVPGYRARAFGHPEPTSAAELEPYDPGATFVVDGITLEAVLTPGHTPHHIALVAHVGAEVFALTADLYTSRPLDAWYESAADDMAASLRRIAAHGTALRVLPTHGRCKDDGARVLAEAAGWLDREADAVRADAERLGLFEPRALAAARYAHLGEDVSDRATRGEISRAAFVRSVLAPVRTLPAAPP
jgi:glyoxylase-like metal-dependent hydrolase (beta-lactamase superfamily II)